MPTLEDYQLRRCEALRIALNDILRIADAYLNAADGTYHNAVMEIFAVVCRALNADAEAGPRYERVRVDPEDD